MRKQFVEEEKECLESALLGGCWRAYLGSLLRESLRELFSGGVFGRFSESVSGERFFGRRVGSSCLESYFRELFSGGDLREAIFREAI